jgi:hypothetical protein
MSVATLRVDPADAVVAAGVGRVEGEPQVTIGPDDERRRLEPGDRALNADNWRRCTRIVDCIRLDCA